MMNLASYINDFASFTPALNGKRVIRLVLHYDENPDTPPPFTVQLLQTPSSATSTPEPQIISNHTFQAVSTTRFRIELEIAAIMHTNGGAMSWAINDALGNLAGTWGGGATLLPSGGNGFIPDQRPGEFTIKDFTVFDGVERTASGLYVSHDIDFVNTQLLSMSQGAAKMRRIAASADTNFTLRFRKRSERNEEYIARRSTIFQEYLNESARVIEFAVSEVRNNQRFDLNNIRFHRTI